MRRLLPRFALVILATGVVLALAARRAGRARPASSAPPTGPAARRSSSAAARRSGSYIYAADGALLATLHGEENRQPVKLTQVPQPVIDAVLAVEDADFYTTTASTCGACFRACSSNVAAGGVEPGRLDDHPAAREARPARRRADVRPQGAGGRPRHPARAAAHQGADPRAVPQHRLLRRPRLRRAGGGGDLLRRRPRRARRGQAALLAGHHPEPGRLRPDPHPERAEERRDDRPRPPGRGRSRSPATEGLWWTAVADLATELHAGAAASPHDYFADRGPAAAAERPQVGILGATTDSATQPCSAAACKVYTTFDPAAQAQAHGGPRRRAAAENGVFTRRIEPERANRERVGVGAIVSVEPATGAVRAMVGGPGLRELPVQHRHPEPAPDRVVVQDLRAGDRSRAGQRRPQDNVTAGAVLRSRTRAARQTLRGRQLRRRRRQRRHASSAATTASSNCAFVRLG